MENELTARIEAEFEVLADKLKGALVRIDHRLLDAIAHARANVLRHVDEHSGVPGVVIVKPLSDVEPVAP